MKQHLTLVGAALLAAVALTTAGCKSGYGSSASAKPYPLKTCIVSDEELGGMGEPVVFTHKGQEIKLCCDNCRKEFDKDPAKFLSKLHH